MRRPRRRPPGYTLVEVLVALALLVAIAAALVPAMVAGRSGDRVDRADTELKALTDALHDFALDVGEWPGALGQLATPIGGGDLDICGNGYSGGAQNRWAGPYLSRPADATLPVGIGAVAQGFGRAAGPGIDYLQLVVPDVEPADAAALDDQVDGDGAGGGTVRWTGGGGQVTVLWNVPIPGC